ncbi:MAG: restriction endonuclease [Actinomycetota bacterium]|nr:restriction endonuclease [Actinomycetota bacterium]
MEGSLPLQFLQTVAASQHVSPWNGMRRREWVDELDLADLYGSEEVSATYGKFFDQRFIDFLHRSLEELDRVNWRKFEALTGEWFARLGWHVELGPGRGDGGIDVRAWPSAEAAISEPAVFIAQCKRQKRHVEQVVVKALHADTVHEGASRGLIVTTSTVAPGARQVIQSRGYSIEVIELGAVRQWIDAMRTPGTGLWLPE